MDMCVILLIIDCHIELCYIVLNKEESLWVTLLTWAQ